jgi:uncharacterized membrane protein
MTEHQLYRLQQAFKAVGIVWLKAIAFIIIALIFVLICILLGGFSPIFFYVFLVSLIFCGCVFVKYREM